MSNASGLHPEYTAYPRQRCFVGHTHEAEWREDLLSACAEVLPEFRLEPWYAEEHFDPTKPLRGKVVQAIANARYGIYDLSSWQDKPGAWHQPRNVLIELGMAIALNRPALLLRHGSNDILPLPACLQGVELLTFSGDYTLKTELRRRLPQWLDVPPDRDWLNRFCLFGQRTCHFREAHPRARQWGSSALRCHITDGVDRDHPAERAEIRAAFDDILGRYGDLSYAYLDELPLADGFQFLLCSHCQMVRTTPFAIYRVTPQTPAEVFIAIGMSIALETIYEYDIPKVLLVRKEEELPSLLRGYEVVEAANSSEIKKKLKTIIPEMMKQVRMTWWKPISLPFEDPISRAWTEYAHHLKDPSDLLRAALLRFREDFIDTYRLGSDLSEPELAQNLNKFIREYILSLGNIDLISSITSIHYPVRIEINIDGTMFSVTVIYSWIEKNIKGIDRYSNTFAVLFEDANSNNELQDHQFIIRFPIKLSESGYGAGGGGEEEEEEEE
jgi:hypothetical protein